MQWNQAEAVIHRRNWMEIVFEPIRPLWFHNEGRPLRLQQRAQFTERLVGC